MYYELCVGTVYYAYLCKTEFTPMFPVSLDVFNVSYQILILYYNMLIIVKFIDRSRLNKQFFSKICNAKRNILILKCACQKPEKLHYY